LKELGGKGEYALLALGGMDATGCVSILFICLHEQTRFLLLFMKNTITTTYLLNKLFASL